MTARLATTMAALVVGAGSLAGASHAAAVPPAELVGHASNWLQRQGFDVGHPTLTLTHGTADTVVADDAGKRWTAVGFAVASAVPGRVIFSDDRTAIRSLADRYGHRGRLTPAQVDAARVLLHEELHQLGTRSGASEADRSLEEGAVEQVARDLLPRFTAELFGHRLHPKDEPRSFDAEARHVQVLSVFGSGASRWTRRAAVAWRADLIRAGAGERRAMVAAALRARDAWGARTGR
jgi:hypothetical protein